MTKKTGRTKQKTRHFFFLIRVEDCAFTKCRKCGNKTKIRKFPLVIHIEPAQLFLLNKKCKYCENCDLIIAKKSEIEMLMVAAFEKHDPDLIGNEYVIAGVVDRKDFREGQVAQLDSAETVDRMHIFKDLLHFEPALPRWYPDRKRR